MKKICFAFLFLISSLLFAEPSITDVLKSFDETLMRSYSTKAQVTIGFITYGDTNTSGTAATYFKSQIENAAKSTRRIKIVPSSEVGEQEQIVVATRTVNLGIKKVSPSEKKYVIDGTYIEETDAVKLTLTLRDSDGNIVSEENAYVPKKEIFSQRLTLYPDNVQLSQEIQKDFDSSVYTSSQKEKITVAASMLDEKGNLVNMLRPGNTVNFMVRTSHNCYLAILMIDANGEKEWLPMTSDFMTANVPRYFPDIPGTVLRVMDGIFGAEQVVIYAASKREDLPAQTDEDVYKTQDLQGITRKLELKPTNEIADLNAASGSFKITYTVVR